MVHVGANSLEDARALASQAAELGAAAISSLAPSYFKPTSVKELIDWCRPLAAAAPETPFYFYDIPSMTGVNLSMPEFLEQAADQLPTLGGIKFTNSNLMAFQLCQRSKGGSFDIPYGTDEWLLAAFALGATGAVGSSFNFAAPIYHRMIAAFRTGNIIAAREEQFRSVEIIQLLGRYGYMAASKALMGILGVPVGPARLPFPSLTGQRFAHLSADLERLGFFDWISPASMDSI